jgi:hypothetical protein
MLIYFVCYRKPADTWICPSKIILQLIRGGTLFNISFNPLNAELNPIRHLLALVGAHHIVHVSRIRVKHVFPLLIYLVLRLSIAFVKIK